MADWITAIASALTAVLGVPAAFLFLRDRFRARRTKLSITAAAGGPGGATGLSVWYDRDTVERLAYDAQIEVIEPSGVRLGHTATARTAAGQKADTEARFRRIEIGLHGADTVSCAVWAYGEGGAVLGRMLVRVILRDRDTRKRVMATVRQVRPNA